LKRSPPLRDSTDTKPCRARAPCSSALSCNAADGSQGGGIFVNNTASGTSIRGCTIAGNSADAGGGVWSENNILAINRSVISGNTALTGDGGGIALQFSYLRLTSSTVRRNHADQGDGGGILLLNITAPSTILANTISANTAQFGGGLACRSCPEPVVMQNSTLSGNRAVFGGGGIYLQDNPAALRIQNSTVAFNRAGSSGGGIQVRSANNHPASADAVVSGLPTGMAVHGPKKDRPLELPGFRSRVGQ
jgi:hypothetical protein